MEGWGGGEEGLRDVRASEPRRETRCARGEVCAGVGSCEMREGGLVRVLYMVSVWCQGMKKGRWGGVARHSRTTGQVCVIFDNLSMYV